MKGHEKLDNQCSKLLIYFNPSIKALFSDFKSINTNYCVVKVCNFMYKTYIMVIFFTFL